MRWRSQARDLRRRFLVGGGADGADAVAEAGDAHADIGVLGDVIGVPGADIAQRGGAEMIGRTAERQRQVERGEPGQENVELAGIFGGEQPGEPTVRGIVDAQRRLHAGEAVAAGAEGPQGLA